jgi:general secretion pathway protein G
MLKINDNIQTTRSPRLRRGIVAKPPARDKKRRTDPMRRRHTPQRIRHNRRGFTLVEVLLVLVILVMLGSLAVGVYSQVQLKAMRKSTLSQINSFKTWIELYQQDMLNYPPDLYALISPDGVENPVRWQGPYLDVQQIPNDPWGSEYRYRYPGQFGFAYDLWSPGQDGTDGTEDDIGNWMQEI